MYVDNEISQLEKVIVHFPDEGISRISPKRAEALLFDDIVFYPLMHEEYRVFERLLHEFIGEENVLETQDLIEESIVNSQDSGMGLIDDVINFEELPPSYSKYLLNLSPRDLSKILITGYLSEDDHILFDPIPNYMFTRDIAVTIKDHVLISKAAKEARHRENLLSRFIFSNHPLFRDQMENNKIIDLNNLESFPPSKRADVVNAEGGDIMMFSPDHLLIGSSERTTPYAFESIKNKIFELGLVDNVVQINIPNERSFMHIDTLFTRVDTDAIACHKPIVYDGEGSNVIVHRINGKQKTYASIKEFIHAEISKEMNFIFSGGGISPFQEREQWTDSCNLVALRPGIGISYDRNLKTLQAFEQAGYKVLDAASIFKYSHTHNHFIKNLDKTIITIPSAELSRARGGSHCMTCPIQRAKS
jgi:arginine deiminase